ncbi:MAG: ABC transporter ATP-binding protein [Anaerolineaceae bacterium]|nr:ABC transporter ATP-binding protein [Anaerolineaceae bacterium]
MNDSITNANMLIAQGLSRQLRVGEHVIHALHEVDLAIEAGEMIGIVGPSGSGKSTLLGLLGGLDRPSSGKVILDGIDISDLSEDRITEIRNEKIGFIFQFFNLIPTLNALENVALPLQFARQPKFRPEQRARELLTRLGLGDRLRHRPAELSGGQQQRVAIARALANQPPLLLADEPTGNLDRSASVELLQLLHEIRDTEKTTIVVVTHDAAIAASLDRALTLEDGRLVEQERAVAATH